MAAGCIQAPPFLGTGKFRDRKRAAAKLTGLFGATYGALSALVTMSLGGIIFTATSTEDTEPLISFSTS
eukprot:2719398-Ditylum_brightwellii.AAC.1